MRPRRKTRPGAQAARARTGIYLEAGPSYMNFKGDDGIEVIPFQALVSQVHQGRLFG